MRKEEGRGYMNMQRYVDRKRGETGRSMENKRNSGVSERRYGLKY
jgi:hypothetical protein